LILFRQTFRWQSATSLSYDQLQRLAAIDSLTGFSTGVFGMARLQEEFAGRRNSAPIGVWHI